MNVPKDYERIIRAKCLEAGLDDVSIMESAEFPDRDGYWVRIVRSNKPEHRLVRGDNLLIGYIALVVNGTGAETESEIMPMFEARAANAVNTLAALIRQRKPEEIPA